MEGAAGRDLECLKIMDGRAGSGNGSEKATPCCLKARASGPELKAKCHTTFVFGWFSKPLSSSGEAHSLKVEDILYKGKLVQGDPGF